MFVFILFGILCTELAYKVNEIGNHKKYGNGNIEKAYQNETYIGTGHKKLIILVKVTNDDLGNLR